MVPRAVPAQHLGQGGGVRSDQAAGGLVHQPAHHQQATAEDVLTGVLGDGQLRGAFGGRGRALGMFPFREPGLGGCGIVESGPFLPQVDRGGECLVDVHGLRWRAVGREPGEREVLGLTRGHGERAGVPALGPVLVRFGQGIAAEDDGVRAGHAHQHTFRVLAGLLVFRHVEAAQPRHRRAEVEAQTHVLEDLHLAGETFDPADQRGAGGQRHEVRDADGSGLGGPHGVQHESVLRVETFNGRNPCAVEDHLTVLVHRACRCQQPPPVIGPAQQ